ncbi:pyruvate, phosphate dikinase [Candidatus Auribacterota bacterium]
MAGSGVLTIGEKVSGGKMKSKYVFFFGDGKADGNALMKNELGGKGANLAEMTSMGVPVPPGFTIATDVCSVYYDNKGKFPESLREEVKKNLNKVERIMGSKFGDPENPLLVSVRSGARSSMPGMMETVLNVGLTEKTIKGLIAKTNNPRFVWDAYRRLIQMYSDVVMEKAAGFEPKEGEGIRAQLESELHKIKKKRGIEQDCDLSSDDLRQLTKVYKEKIKKVLKKQFPDDAMEQLWGAVRAVFQSWNGKRAIAYRRIENIPGEWGTAVNVQTMVFGNMGETSATGVAFTRNPATGENVFYGEWLVNAQGEDVVAGLRTPSPINESGKTEHSRGHVSLEKGMPVIYKELNTIQLKLEKHYKDMLDIEFTIQEGRLWMLQCRVGKRNGPAAVRMAVEMVKEKLINSRTAVMRVTPDQLDELLHPILDPKVEARTKPFAKGLPAGPGGACGMIVFTAADAVKWAKDGKTVILVREETNPEDVEGMRSAEAILTARGGMTSHAALVARGWGKCCIVGAGAIDINLKARTLSCGGETLKEGSWVSLNGTRGYVYTGQITMVKTTEDNPYFRQFMKFTDEIRTLGVRTNADTPEDARKARGFGAEGIGLFRTEHMFYGKGSEEPLFKLRKMIVSKTVDERRSALKELFKYVKTDIKATLKAMEGLPVTVRLLDPPLHEFIPHSESGLVKLAKALKVSMEELKARATLLKESNPMMGHRGVRLGVTFPEVAEMQVRAVFEAAAELQKSGIKVFPEIMIPVVSLAAELKDQFEIVENVYREVLKKKGVKNIPHLVGTMIEIPRACIVADTLAERAQFFSFGTNDLTQMGYGFSRDDMGGFLPDYMEKSILPADPFQTLDQRGIGELVKMGIERGRKARKDLKIGICGEHGGDPDSVEFCYKAGMNYVSCSPFRVPIARLAAAQAVIKNK